MTKYPLFCDVVKSPLAPDLTNRRFGRHPKRRDNALGWVCQCDCGNQKWIANGNLRSGNSNSCGCFHKEQLSERVSTHGLSKTPIYAIWRTIKQRCLNPGSPRWEYYGGRGIKVCERWQNSFEAFLEDMGEPPKGMSIDRIDNDGDYAPGNCRWATHVEQCNNRRSNHILEANGRAQNVTQWAKELGVSKRLLLGRLGLGWSHHDIVNTPTRVRRRA